MWILGLKGLTSFNYHRNSRIKTAPDQTPTSRKGWNYVSIVYTNVHFMALWCFDFSSLLFLDWRLIRVEGRAVKKFLNSKLMMDSRQLWILHQRHNFLRAEASRDILKSLGNAISRGIPCRCHFASSEYTQDWEQCHRNIPGVPRHHTVPNVSQI